MHQTQQVREQSGATSGLHERRIDLILPAPTGKASCGFRLLRIFAPLRSRVSVASWNKIVQPSDLVIGNATLDVRQPG